MEFILENTDIFDEEIETKLHKIILNNRDFFKEGDVYKFRVTFHVDVLFDKRFKQFNILTSKINDGSWENTVSEVLSLILKKLDNLLANNGIEVTSSTIQGDNLESENLVKIEIIEDTSEPIFTGKGKKKQRMKVLSIVPSLPYTYKTAGKLASDRINKLYGEIRLIIEDPKLMSEILGIEETDNEEILFKAFAKQYGELWLTTPEREKELKSQFLEKSLSVIDKRIEKGDTQS
ncbi:hypothetical protein ACQCN2_09485 [Brevibacillus ginsengisoli]|uniref:hypothetical protein n=1 Tax=Brevibacillus ginsengisoli TaxID=363854 RepID=UPI003CEC054C